MPPLLTQGSVDQLDDDVEMTEVARILLQQMEQDPDQGRRVRCVRESAAGFGALVEVRGRDDMTGNSHLRLPGGEYLFRAAV